MDPDVEKVAEAIWAADREKWESPKHWTWNQVTPTRRDTYRRMAQAAIDALDAARSEHLPTDGQILSSLVVPWK